jgi:hypothetical protein
MFDYEKILHISAFYEFVRIIDDYIDKIRN